MRCARANGFPVVMLHATPDNDDGCEFSRFFGVTSSDIPTHVHVTLEPPFPDTAFTLPPVSCTVPDVRLRVRARDRGRNDTTRVDLRRTVHGTRTCVVHRPLPAGE